MTLLLSILGILWWPEQSHPSNLESSMRVLLTGAFGNIGREVIPLLLLRGYEVRCFDIKTKTNQKIYRSFLKDPTVSGKMEMVWGDIRELSQFFEAVKGVDAIIHLSAIIPPLSEKEPAFAYAINVGGTQNLMEAAKGLAPNPRFIFSSSVSIYGPRMTDPPPRRATDSANPTDNYTRHKVQCEKMLKESTLPWVTLRVAVVQITSIMGRWDPIIFKIPLDQRTELVSAKDVARACVNALTADAVGKVLLIGGGKSNQMLQRDFMKGVMEAAGIGMLPESAFINPNKNSESDWFYTDYYDTQEAQEVLQFQADTFDDYIKELKGIFGPLRILIQLFSPVIRRFLLLKSPYYKATL